MRAVLLLAQHSDDGAQALPGGAAQYICTGGAGHSRSASRLAHTCEYESMHGGSCAGMSPMRGYVSHVQVYALALMCAISICTSTHVCKACASMCKHVQVCASMCKYVQVRVSMCKSVQVRASMCTSTHACHEQHLVHDCPGAMAQQDMPVQHCPATQDQTEAAEPLQLLWP